MNTLLTDDEIIDVIRKAGLRVIGPHKSLARAVEAAVLAKLAQQEPALLVRCELPQHKGQWMAEDGRRFLLSDPAPQQADHQRVPDGHVLVPAEALTRWRDAFAEELAAYDIDPPIHHVLTSHDEIAAMLAAAPEAPAQFDWSKFPGYLIDRYEGETLTEELLQQAAAEIAAPEAPAQASAVDDDYKGWYCAHCQRGVDASEVTFREQHQACGRVITDDRPPKVHASAVDERDRKDAERYRWLRDSLVSDDPYGLLEQAFGHLDKDQKPTAEDFDAGISAALAQKGQK